MQTNTEFDQKLSDLQRHVEDVKASAKAAASEDHARIKQRIDKAHADADGAAMDAKRKTGEARDDASASWAKMKADASAKMTEFKAHADQRANQVDAKVAAKDADWAADDAAEAIDYADWAVQNASLAILAAIDARVYADERAAMVSLWTYP